MRTNTITTALAGLLLSHAATAASVPDEDRSGSPHFEVLGSEENHEGFPLKSTDVTATISGVIADVTVTQTYANTGQSPIEAVYVFPASTRAAVHGVEMQVGERIIKARIKEKAKAKAIYEKAKSENKTASLLEQERPNVFKMNVANILPGDEVQVTLHYSEKLTATARIYEFVYPTVVGPRYSNKGSDEASWVSNPYLAEGIASPTTFAISVDVRAGMPLQSLTSPSHAPGIQFTGKDQATVSLAADTVTGDRDFVLHYQLADQQVASGLLLEEGKEENFFLLNVEPPARVVPDQIPARDYLFVIDVSGSMHGFPLETTKSLMRDLISGIRQTDTFNVLFFAGGNNVLSDTPLPATQDNLALALALLDSSRAGGGTELLPALKTALAMPREENASRSIVVVTDGFVNIETEAYELVSRELGRANLFAFGIGSSVNRWLVEGLAHAGKGEPFFVLNPGEAGSNAARFRDYISSPVLTGIKVRYEGFDATDVQPTHLPDVFADRPIELIGKWQGAPTGRIILTGTTGNGPWEASFDVADVAKTSRSNPALRPLWAREKVRTLSHRKMVASREATDDLAGEITELGLNYQLLTEYTSFVGVDETPREVLAKLRKVNQPLNLPNGVSNHALGENQMMITHGTGATASAPEPGVASLVLLTLLGFALRRRR